MTFSRMLPAKSGALAAERADPIPPANAGDRFLHARLQGTKLGVFDVYYDSTAPEQVQAGQAKAAENGDDVLRRLDIIFTGCIRSPAEQAWRDAGAGKRETA